MVGERKTKRERERGKEREKNEWREKRDDVEENLFDTQFNIAQ